MQSNLGRVPNVHTIHSKSVVECEIGRESLKEAVPRLLFPAPTN